jgi:hypothetical protein
MLEFLLLGVKANSVKLELDTQLFRYIASSRAERIILSDVSQESQQQQTHYS